MDVETIHTLAIQPLVHICMEFDMCLNATISFPFQREELRARFPGVPGDLVNYFLYVAEEVISIPAILVFHLFILSFGNLSSSYPAQLILWCVNQILLFVSG